MFTGIIEDLGKIVKIEKENSNIHYYIDSKLTPELKIDQSVSHNGVCLTVVAIDNNIYKVTAIEETILKTNIGCLKENNLVNLERALKIGDRLDGHFVQGHVDQTAICIGKENKNGSYIFTFTYDDKLNNVTIEKGSITINGTSLTVVNSKNNEFSVAIIPYTYQNTVFNTIKIKDTVNLEFDVLGKYIQKLLKN